MRVIDALINRARREPRGRRTRLAGLRRRRLRKMAVAATAAVAAGLVAVAAPTTGGASSSTTTVTASVGTATTLSTTGCATGTTGVTSFGAVPTSTSVVTATDCSVVFGSSADTATLRMYQRDGLGTALWMPTQGAFDGGFDTDGKLTTSFGSTLDNSAAIGLQADGKIVAGAGTGAGAAQVARYNADGSLDTGFDVDGKASFSGMGRVFAIAVQPDQKILLASWVGNPKDFVVARLTAAGALDTTFSGDGYAVVAVSGGMDEAFSLAVQGDGNILAAGHSYNGTNNDIAIVRLKPDGSLDPGFDSDGLLTVPVGTGNDVAQSIALQDDGKIVVGGSADGAAGSDAAVIRLASTGALDTTFSGDGKATAAPGSGLELFVQPDGNIILGGTRGADFAAFRFRTDGTLDPAFDADGVATIDVGATESAYGAVLQPDGKLLVSGITSTDSGDFAFARFRPDGSVDTSFGAAGTLLARMTPGYIDEIFDIRAGVDGKVIAAGGTSDGITRNLAVIQLASTPVADFAAAASDWAVGPNTFGACLRSVTGTGVVGAWTVDSDNSCTAVNTDPWNKVAATAATTGSSVATSGTAGTTDATANLRFGIRTASNQPPGTYLAPVVFELVAPAV